MVTRISQSPEETLTLGETLGQELRPGDVVGLIGDLGAGKTLFVKGLARGLGIPTRIHSPTFTLVNEYAADSNRLFHLDLYRLETPEQILAAGLEPYLYPEGAVTVIEWYDRWSRDLPQPARGWIIRFEAPDPATRTLHYEAI